MKKINLILLSILILGINSRIFCQGLSQAQTNTINTKIDVLVKDYVKYSFFTENGNYISNKYIYKFKTLFREDALLYNDLNVKEVNPEIGLTLDDYCNTVKSFYYGGLSADVTGITTSLPVLKDNVYEVIVKANKVIEGFNESDGVMKNNYIVIMTINFDKELTHFYFTEVRNEKYKIVKGDKKVAAPKTKKGIDNEAKSENTESGSNILTLKVLDNLNYAVPGAKVTLEVKGNKYQKITSSSGEINFSNLPQDEFIFIKAVKENLLGYIKGTFDELKNIKKISIKDQKLGSLLILKVLDDSNDNPVEGAEVILRYENEKGVKARKITDSEGYVTFDSIPEGTNIGFKAKKNRYIGEPLIGNVNDLIKLKNIFLKLKEKPAETTELICQVTNKKNNTPVNNIKVSVNCDSKIYQAKTGVDGLAKFPGLNVDSKATITVDNKFGFEPNRIKTVTIIKNNKEQIFLYPINDKYLNINISGLSTGIKSNNIFSETNDSIFVNGRIKKSYGFNVDVDYSKTLFMTNKLAAGFGFGLGLSSYNSEIIVDSINNSFTDIDIENDSYKRVIKAISLKENIGLMYIDVPVFIFAKFLTGSNLLNNIFINTGLKFSYNFSYKDEVKDGRISYTGYYPIPNGDPAISTLDYFNFPQDTTISSTRNKYKTQKLAVFYYLNPGFGFRLKDNIVLNIGADIIVNLTNITKNSDTDKYVISKPSNNKAKYDDRNDYNSILSKSNKTGIFSIGARLGISYKF